MANPNPTPPPLEHQFKKGEAANPGGKTGTRRKLERKYLEDLQEVWAAKGKAAIDKLIDEKPEHVLKAVGALLPKQITVDDAGSADRQRLAKLLELVDRRLEELASPSEPRVDPSPEARSVN